MYKKQIPCPECNGHGYISGGNENGSWAKTCPHCMGKRNITVPMTRADRFRSMTDEELVNAIQCIMNAVIQDQSFFCQEKVECMNMMDSPNEIPDEWCKRCLLEWLRKPADGTRIRYGFDDKQESGLFEED